MGDPDHRQAFPCSDMVPLYRAPKQKFRLSRMEVVMKAKMKPAIMALALTMGVCLLFPVVATAQQQCTPDPVHMFIAYGNIILCSIDAPGISDLFRFDGTAGERIKIETLGTAYPCMELVGVTAACSYGSHQNWIDTVLPTTQEYTIRVYDEFTGTGSYTLYLERTVPPNPSAQQTTYGQDLPDQFNLPGDLDEFFFTASAGDVVDITTTSGSVYPCFTLFAPDARTAWSACSYGSHTNELRTPPLTLAGTYTILLYDEFNSVGGYRIALECVTGPCVVTPIPDVSGYATFKGAPLVGAGVSLSQVGAPALQLTRTDSNGYYQFLHIISGRSYNVLIHGQGDLDTPASGDAASATTADQDSH